MAIYRCWCTQCLSFYFGVDKLDPYAGAFLGYNVASVKTAVAAYNGTAGGFTWAGFAGAHYYFTEKIGAFVKLRHGISTLTVGLAVKL